jgi:hypothetical protein
MQPKQIAAPCNPIAFSSNSIINTIYNNSAHIKAGGNKGDGKTNKRRISRLNIAY